MTELDTRLVGQWRRSTEAAAAKGYAGHLHFQANGLYFGQASPPDTFTWWDGGTWAIHAPGRLALSTANDAVVAYSYQVDHDTLTITDASGCRITYRRDA
ncbi:hypothetical protein [Pseudomonas sp. BN411]|uniref:hypothetical protein n=1 Tax=Pseudomonas sp. BN411 TaxID=2567887 RepID=UPI002454967E|nr:hypothetical protein [Pseudomonas sp. BN411]MDH4562659.1 hypothetical protein [Pseudomonas sp. BN411]